MPPASLQPVWTSAKLHSASMGKPECREPVCAIPAHLPLAALKHEISYVHVQKKSKATCKIIAGSAAALPTVSAAMCRRNTATRSSPDTPARHCPQGTAPPRAPPTETRQPRQSTTWHGPLIWSTAHTSSSMSLHSGETCDPIFVSTHVALHVHASCRDLGRAARLLAGAWRHACEHEPCPYCSILCGALPMGMARGCKHL